jgi:succinyl-CoA synthetase beta subunit
LTKLLEHEVKEIISQHGVKVPRSKLFYDAKSAEEFAKELNIAVYVKAQVLAGDRASVGAVRRCESYEDVARDAAEILGMSIYGIPVESILVEEAVDAKWFGYASASIAEAPARRILRFSRSGGSGFNPDNCEVQLEWRDATEQYKIRKALRIAGVPSEEIGPVSEMLSSLVESVETWACYMLELNPIALTSNGIIALDAKADLDDYSKLLIPDSSYLDEEDRDENERLAREFQSTNHRGSLRYVQLVSPQTLKQHFYVATHSVGGGESMVVLDALSMVGLEPTNYCDTSGSPPVEKVAFASKLVTSQPHVRGLLFSTCIANQDLSVTATGLVQGWDESNWSLPTVARFAGNNSDIARQIVSDWSKKNNRPVVVVGEEVDEWQSAEMLADLLNVTPEEKAQR